MIIGKDLNLSDHRHPKSKQEKTESGRELPSLEMRKPHKIYNFLRQLDFTDFAILTFGLSCSGHMSTMPVTRDSTMQNSESMPMVTSMKKKTTAQTEPPGSFNTTLKMIMVTGQRKWRLR